MRRHRSASAATRRGKSEKQTLPAVDVGGNKIRVAVYDDVGGSSTKKGESNCRGAADLEVCLKTKDMYVVRVTGYEIANGILERGIFNVLIHPGGEGVAQGRSLGVKGMRAIRAFVSSGGGYLGICAGANLASADDNYMPYSLGLVSSKTLDTTPKYPQVKNLRGVGYADIQLTPLGREIFKTEKTHVRNVVYANGPMIMKSVNAKTKDPLRSRYEVLATYSSEVAGTMYGRDMQNIGGEWSMVGKTAAVTAPYGDGRVLCLSPHPEKPDGPHFMIRNAVRWLGGRASPCVAFRPSLHIAENAAGFATQEDADGPAVASEYVKKTKKPKKRVAAHLSNNYTFTPPLSPRLSRRPLPIFLT